jgi:hypothetical protein
MKVFGAMTDVQRIKLFGDAEPPDAQSSVRKRVAAGFTASGPLVLVS